MTRCSYVSQKLHRFQNKEVSMEVRLGALKLYRKHLVEQYADRCAWWSLKDISGESMSRTMTIMTDGADQVPWANVLPYYSLILSHLKSEGEMLCDLGFFPVQSAGKVPNPTRPFTTVVLPCKQAAAPEVEDSRFVVLWV